MLNLPVHLSMFRFGIFRSFTLYLSVFLFLTSCADLVVEDVKYEQFTGPNLVMKGTVKNQGNKSAEASTTSLERKYNLSDSYTSAASVSTPPLAAGANVELPLWIFPPTDLPQPGSCLYTRVCADVNNNVDESFIGISFEGNNCLVKSFMNDRYCSACDRCCQETLPLVFDWRNVNGTDYVSPVRDQRMCGSCWAFSAIATVEAKRNIEAQQSAANSLDLSEQELVSCPTGGGSCLGGWPSTAFNYIKNDRVVEEGTLPYTSINCVFGDPLQCTAGCSSPTVAGCANPLMTGAQCSNLGSGPPSKWSIDHAQWIGTNTIDGVKRALLCHGPLSVTSSEWSHAILLVGWTNNSWIFKNSWGANWNGNGYGFIPFTGHVHSDIKDNAYYVHGIREWN